MNVSQNRQNKTVERSKRWSIYEGSGNWSTLKWLDGDIHSSCTTHKFADESEKIVFLKLVTWPVHLKFRILFSCLTFSIKKQRGFVDTFIWCLGPEIDGVSGILISAIKQFNLNTPTTEYIQEKNYFAEFKLLKQFTGKRAEWDEYFLSCRVLDLMILAWTLNT